MDDKDRLLAVKGRVYPTDLNPAGTVFGGWVMGKMDKAASIAVDDIVFSKFVTVSVSNLHFKKPIRSGDIFTIYTKITNIGNTSITIKVEVEVKDHVSNKEFPVTEADFKFVTVNSDGSPRAVREVLRREIPDYVAKLAE